MVCFKSSPAGWFPEVVISGLVGGGELSMNSVSPKDGKSSSDGVSAGSSVVLLCLPCLPLWCLGPLRKRYRNIDFEI